MHEFQAFVVLDLELSISTGRAFRFERYAWSCCLDPFQPLSAPQGIRFNSRLKGEERLICAKQRLLISLSDDDLRCELQLTRSLSLARTDSAVIVAVSRSDRYSASLGFDDLSLR